MLQLEWVDETTLTQLTLLLLSFVLSAVIGVERQRRLKSAGLRTHTLVGLGATVFTLVSAYGFSAVLGADVQLDPSRIAAQIVSGIGFLGAGVIFVKQNMVNGLTTAASIWLTAAVGMACGAGMPVLAIAATGLYLVTVGVLTVLGRRIRRANLPEACVVRYKEGREVIRDVLAIATEMGFDATLASTRMLASPKNKADRVEARLHFVGRAPLEDLVDRIDGIRGVISVELERDDD